jgi:predicted RND superfamily exporter protein
MSQDAPSTRLERAVLRPLADAQIAHPWWFVVLALCSIVAALSLASQLKLKTALGELLPENKQSVIVADRVRQRLTSVSTLSVVAEGSDNDTLKRFVDAASLELRKIGPPLIGTVDAGVQDARQFFHERRFLYAPLSEVQRVVEEIEDRYAYEVGKRAGLLLDEDDPPPPLTEKSIRGRLESRATKSGAVRAATARYPDGYYLDESEHRAVILVHTPIRSGDVSGSTALLDAVKRAVTRVKTQHFDANIRVAYGGNLLTSAETRAQIESDLAHVGLWGVALILSVVFLYYLRLRTMVAMTLTVGTGAVWTFGLAYLLVGHLNSSTGFLFSIVVGNGINFGIIYMARYLEARREQDAETSLRIAQLQTWTATLTASAAATCAYGSLVVTDFRGFKDFGLIGGSGMLLCWLATYLLLPPMLLLFERLAPIRPPTGWLARVRGLYGKPFAWLARHFPRQVLATAAIVTLAAAYLATAYLRNDPIEYNMRRVGNDAAATRSDAQRLAGIVHKIVGRQGVDGLALATDHVAQVLPLKAKLLERRDAAAEGAKPFADVVTIFSVIPKHQEEKLALVKRARGTLHNAYQKGFIQAKDWQQVEQLFPMDHLRVIGIADLPEQVARPFTEKDGTRGKLVYITPARGRTVWDGKYLITWADAIRKTTLPDASVVHGSGRSVIFADMILAVAEDAPKAIAVSLLLTLLVVGVAFRRKKAGLYVVAAVLMGLLWTLGILAIAETNWPWSSAEPFALRPLKLNFLNFVALPITIGVGADYAVNIMQRYAGASGEGATIEHVVVETGGAVVLCSLTTTLGYAALTLSMNRAVQGFGVAAVAGEIACVITGVLVLPAYIGWRTRRGTSS